MYRKILLLALPLLIAAGYAAKESALKPAAAQDNISVFFSPNGGCTQAIVEGIDSAKRDIAVQAFYFTSTKIAQLMRAHLMTPPPPPSTLQPAIQRRWSELTLRAMSKLPEDRYPDARMLKTELLTVMDTPIPRPVPSALKPVTPRPMRVPLDVDVLAADGSSLRRTCGMELSKDGIFLAGTRFAPPLFSSPTHEPRTPSVHCCAVAGLVVSAKVPAKRHITARRC